MSGSPVTDPAAQLSLLKRLRMRVAAWDIIIREDSVWLLGPRLFDRDKVQKENFLTRYRRHLQDQAETKCQYALAYINAFDGVKASLEAWSKRNKALLSSKADNSEYLELRTAERSLYG